MFWILVTIVIILIILLSTELLIIDEPFNKIPGPTGLPIIGSALDFMQDQEKTFYLMRHLANQYKDIFKLKMGPMKNCAIYNPDDVELLISGTKYTSKSFLYRFLKPWLQEGLLLSDGKKWRQRRKILTPAFHFNTLRHFYSILIENSNKLAALISLEHHKSETELLPLITDFTLHSICETAMGKKIDGENSDYARSYKAAIHKLGVYILYRTQRVWLYSNLVFNCTILARKQRKLLNLLSTFRNAVINSRKKYAELEEIPDPDRQSDRPDTNDEMLQGKRRLAMLDLLLRAKEQGIIDTQGICEEVDTFMFEGHDTTASALQFIFMLLANNQESQDKIVKEYTDVLGSTSHDATMRDMSSLKYLECCIKESLRLYPPVPFFSRRCHEPLKLKNYSLPAGTDVTVLVYDMHRRGDIFPDPTTFRPERFITDQPSWHHFAYIPFSAGPRNCIGQKFAMIEMKVAVTTVLRRFRLLPVTKPEDIVFVSDFILRSKHPIYVKFKNRD